MIARDAMHAPRVPARGSSAETFKITAGGLMGAEISVAMLPMPGAGKVKVTGTFLHWTRSADFTAGELQRLRDQIDQALEGLA